MKKILALAILFLLPVIGYSEDASFLKTGGGNDTTVGTMANEDGLAYNRNYYLDVDVYGANRISSVINYSSVTFANVEFSTTNITLATGNINKANTFTLALPVLLNQTAGTLPVPLADKTTYYAINVDANNIKLATTSVQAIANDPIIFISSSVTGTQTYTLSALSNAGNPIFAYYASNDGINFFDLSMSSTPTTYNAVNWGYNIGEFNYNTLKLAVTSPTAGVVKFKATLNLKE